MSFREEIHWFFQIPAGALGLLSLAGWHGRPAPASPAVPDVQPVRGVESVAGEHSSQDEALELNREIPALLHSAERLAGRTGCRLEYAVAPRLAVHADLRAFREAMAGLLAHAIAQAPGGQVLVAAGRQPGAVQISVTDNGAGADAGMQQARLHEPIGLLARQRGSVSIAPHPGQGTVVTVRLPEAASPFAATIHAAGVAEPSLARG